MAGNVIHRIIGEIVGLWFYFLRNLNAQTYHELWRYQSLIKLTAVLFQMTSFILVFSCQHFLCGQGVGSSKFLRSVWQLITTMHGVTC